MAKIGETVVKPKRVVVVSVLLLAIQNNCLFRQSIQVNDFISITEQKHSADTRVVVRTANNHLQGLSLNKRDAICDHT